MEYYFLERNRSTSFRLWYGREDLHSFTLLITEQSLQAIKEKKIGPFYYAYHNYVTQIHTTYLKNRFTHNLNITAENVYDDEHMPFSEKLCQKETTTYSNS